MIKELEELETLIKQKGSLRISHNPDGSGMGYYWTANLGDAWPYCSSGTLESTLKLLVHEHRRLEREALQKRINAIDASSGL